jgi:translation elongation factor EF-Ts
MINNQKKILNSDLGQSEVLQDQEADQLDSGLEEIIQLCKKLQENARKRKSQISDSIFRVQELKNQLSVLRFESLNQLNTSIDDTGFQTTIDKLQSQLDAVNLSVKKALASCRQTLEKANENLLRSPVAESDDLSAELQ